MVSSSKKSSRDDPAQDSDARVRSLEKELELLKKMMKDKNDTIAELNKVVSQLNEMVGFLKTCFASQAAFGGPTESQKDTRDPRVKLDRQEEKSDRKGLCSDKNAACGKMEPSGTLKKKVSFAEILREEKAKPSFEIDKIKGSKWIGRDFKYLVSLKDGRDLWLSLKEFNAEKLVSDFHEAQPNAARPNDYTLSNGWRTIKKKEITIQKKLSTKKGLSSQEIDFIALKLTSPPQDAKEFKRVHVQIANKQAIAKCSYNQKLSIIRKVIHSYGLSASVVRISFIGSSIMEIYVQADAEHRFISGMKCHGWDIVKDFDFYEVKSFDGQARSDAKKEECSKALVQRLAYLIAGTKLVKLRECILEGLKESTKAQILERVQEIKDAREGQRTAYVLQRQ